MLLFIDREFIICLIYCKDVNDENAYGQYDVTSYYKLFNPPRFCLRNKLYRELIRLEM